jgi:hypothetical protein
LGKNRCQFYGWRAINTDTPRLVNWIELVERENPTFVRPRCGRQRVAVGTLCMDSRGQTYATIRYPINLKIGWVAGVKGTGRYFSI